MKQHELRRELVNGDSVEPMDELLLCCDCDEQFLFTVGERQFFADRNLQQPRRCKPCRAAKRAEQR